MPSKSYLFGHFWDPFGSLRGSLVRLLVTKVAQRHQKVSQKRSNGSKAYQKGPKKTNWLAFVENFLSFLKFSGFCPKLQKLIEERIREGLIGSVAPLIAIQKLGPSLFGNFVLVQIKVIQWKILDFIYKYIYIYIYVQCYI